MRLLWQLGTGNCISRRNREEIPGSFGWHGCAVRDVVGAGASTSASSRSGSSPNSSASSDPGGNSDSNFSSGQECAAADPISEDRIFCRRFVRRGWFFQRRTLGGFARLGRFSWSERDSLAGVHRGWRPILRNVEDSGSRAGAISHMPAFLPVDVAHLQRDNARIQRTFRRAFCPPQI